MSALLFRVCTDVLSRFSLRLLIVGICCGWAATGWSAQEPESSREAPAAHADAEHKAEAAEHAADEHAEAHGAAEHGAAHHGDDEHDAGDHSDSHDGEHHAGAHGTPPSIFSVLPFAALLVCIAILPLTHSTAHWWEHNSSKLMVAGICGALTLAYYALIHGAGVVDHSNHELSAAGFPAIVVVLKNAILGEYIPFIVLLFALYVISGGINIAGNLRGNPATNFTILLIGALIASFVGTTGAAMVLIRPLLRANALRQHIVHSFVFFIFIVCNTGGCLLPIGDPPLFLGYLKGVDFFWTLNLIPHWAMMNGALLVIYYVWDCLMYRKEDQDLMAAPPVTPEAFQLRGAINLLWLLGVIICAATLDPSKPFPGTSFVAPQFFREGLMLLLVGLSLVTTPAIARKANSFNYNAIIEVAALFIGIFICMQAPIEILNTYGSKLGIDQPWKFYWCTGILSSFLDNAPTYVVFFETAKTVPSHSPMLHPELVPIGVVELAAISLGAVFMGSMTYIGNGPNFMVKTIAEQGNVRMPSFFGYMLYSCAVVFPVSVILTLIFFR